MREQRVQQIHVAKETQDTDTERGLREREKEKERGEKETGRENQ